jgi:hypothetical protein
MVNSAGSVQFWAIRASASSGQAKGPTKRLMTGLRFCKGCSPTQFRVLYISDVMGIRLELRQARGVEEPLATSNRRAINATPAAAEMRTPIRKRFHEHNERQGKHPNDTIAPIVSSQSCNVTRRGRCGEYNNRRPAACSTDKKPRPLVAEAS